MGKIHLFISLDFYEERRVQIFEFKDGIYGPVYRSSGILTSQAVYTLITHDNGRWNDSIHTTEIISPMYALTVHAV